MNSRRQFITKAAAGGVVAALASKRHGQEGVLRLGVLCLATCQEICHRQEIVARQMSKESHHTFGKRFSMAIDPSPPRKLLVISNGKMCLAWADLLLASQEKVKKLSETF